MVSRGRLQRADAPGPLYNVVTATDALPLVEQIVADMQGAFDAMQTAAQEGVTLQMECADTDEGQRRIRENAKRVAAHRDALEGYANELRELRIEPRDYEKGYVDFPTLMHGEPAFLCWAPGEKEVRQWHGFGQRFADRRPV